MMDVKGLMEDCIVKMANGEKLSEVRLKLQVISRELNNDSLSYWVEKEFLYGYQSTDKLPLYRRIEMSDLKADFVVYRGFGGSKYTKTSIPFGNLSKSNYNELAIHNCKETVVVLDRRLRENEGNVMFALTANEKLMVQGLLPEKTDILNIYKIYSREPFQDVIDQSLSKTLDIFMGLNEKIFQNDLKFDDRENQKTISKVVNNNFGISVDRGATFQMNSSELYMGKEYKIIREPKQNEKILNLIKQIEGLAKDVVQDREEIAYEIAIIKKAIEENRPNKYVRSALFSIKGIFAGVTANKITELINQALFVLG